MSPQDLAESDPAFESLIRHVQESRGVDFRGYKRSSLRRRIGVRMAQVNAPDFASYQSLLEAEPQEFNALLDTVLINVTAFFRDPDAWAVLREEVIPRLVQQGDGHDPIRIWSVGCATGEEPYSVAMLFAEALGISDFSRRVKIYATDLDEPALQQARQASYSQRDVEMVPPSLLAKYFEPLGDRMVFRRELRKAVIFGQHNVVTSAPISRIDLVMCRNLLIYFDAETQDAVLPRLHYALLNDGFLLLGKAETQLIRSRLFTPFNLKQRLFRKVATDARRTPGGSISFVPDSGFGGQNNRLLEAVADAASTAYLAVDAAGLLVFVNIAARRLLDVQAADIGRLFQDLPISYRPTELRSRIEEVQRSGRPLRLEHQQHHRPPADPVRLTIEITPIAARDGRQIATLLAFSDTTRLHTLQQELDGLQKSLEVTIEELQSANEELETTNEELQSTNEELETTNEELQSTNEELETTNEELRSTNDQLEATNEELHRESARVQEYRAHANSVLRSIEAGVIVLDAELRVQSWNRWCENTWGLRAEEVIGQSVFGLDIGLPARELETAGRQVLAGTQEHAEATLDSVDRRGRTLRCRVRIAPLLRDQHAIAGLVLILDAAAGTAE